MNFSYPSPKFEEIFRPPINGGFPIIPSKPPRSMNTSGNSSVQCSGLGHPAPCNR